MDIKPRRQEMREEIRGLMVACKQAEASQNIELIVGVLGKGEKRISEAKKDVGQYLRYIVELDKWPKIGIEESKLHHRWNQ